MAETGTPRVDSFAFRRFRPSVRGAFARRFEFYFNPDFAGGTLVGQDVYVDAVLGRSLRIRAGKGTTPFGLERLHAASNRLFFSRALPTALTPNRDVGLQILGDVCVGVNWYLIQHFRYTLNLERTVLDNHSGGSRTAENAFVARTQVSP